MLLTVHNLPRSMEYLAVKAFISEKCGCTNFIMDNLLPENGLQKVTVGFDNEVDAAILVRSLNGLYFNGNYLYVDGNIKKHPERTPNELDYDNSFYANALPQPSVMHEPHAMVPSAYSSMAQMIPGVCQQDQLLMRPVYQDLNTPMHSTYVDREIDPRFQDSYYQESVNNMQTMRYADQQSSALYYDNNQPDMLRTAPMQQFESPYFGDYDQERNYIQTNVPNRSKFGPNGSDNNDYNRNENASNPTFYKQPTTRFDREEPIYSHNYDRNERFDSNNRRLVHDDPPRDMISTYNTGNRNMMQNKKRYNDAEIDSTNQDDYAFNKRHASFKKPRFSDYETRSEYQGYDRRQNIEDDRYASRDEGPINFEAITEHEGFVDAEFDVGEDNGRTLDVNVERHNTFNVRRPRDGYSLDNFNNKAFNRNINNKYKSMRDEINRDSGVYQQKNFQGCTTKPNAVSKNNKWPNPKFVDKAYRGKPDFKADSHNMIGHYQKNKPINKNFFPNKDFAFKNKQANFTNVNKFKNTKAGTINLPINVFNNVGPNIKNDPNMISVPFNIRFVPSNREHAQANRNNISYQKILNRDLTCRRQAAAQIFKLMKDKFGPNEPDQPFFAKNLKAAIKTRLDILIDNIGVDRDTLVQKYLEKYPIHKSQSRKFYNFFRVSGPDPPKFKEKYGPPKVKNALPKILPIKREEETIPPLDPKLQNALDAELEEIIQKIDVDMEDFTGKAENIVKMVGKKACMDRLKKALNDSVAKRILNMNSDLLVNMRFVGCGPVKNKIELLSKILKGHGLSNFFSAHCGVCANTDSYENYDRLVNLETVTVGNSTIVIKPFYRKHFVTKEEVIDRYDIQWAKTNSLENIYYEDKSRMIKSNISHCAFIPIDLSDFIPAAVALKKQTNKESNIENTSSQGDGPDEEVKSQNLQASLNTEDLNSFSDYENDTADHLSSHSEETKEASSSGHTDVDKDIDIETNKTNKSMETNDKEISENNELNDPDYSDLGFVDLEDFLLLDDAEDQDGDDIVINMDDVQDFAEGC